MTLAESILPMGSFFAITEESNEVLVSRMLDHFQLHMEFSLHLTPFFFFQERQFVSTFSINGFKTLSTVIYMYVCIRMYANVLTCNEMRRGNVFKYRFRGAKDCFSGSKDTR